MQLLVHIDTLTYNRIVGRDFENLTKFQQDIIKEVVCKLADFEYEISPNTVTWPPEITAKSGAISPTKYAFAVN